jgi:hypothetical protein
MFNRAARARSWVALAVTMNGQQHGMVAPAPSAVKHPGANVCQRAKHVPRKKREGEEPGETVIPTAFLAIKEPLRLNGLRPRLKIIDGTPAQDLGTHVRVPVRIVKGRTQLLFATMTRSEELRHRHVTAGTKEQRNQSQYGRHTTHRMSSLNDRCAEIAVWRLKMKEMKGTSTGMDDTIESGEGISECMTWPDRKGTASLPCETHP